MNFDIITTFPCVDTTTSTSTTTTVSTVTTTTTTESTTSTSTTLQCIPQDLQRVSPDVFSSAISLFGSFPSGYYQVAYLYGALKFYNGGPDWSIVFYDGKGYQIAHSGGGTVVDGPSAGFALFPTQAEVEQFNANQVVSFYHSGGTIGMYLNDGDYTDNVAGQPNPTYLLRRICPS